MLTELRVCDLGVIAELSLVLDRGLIAVTGETGAGKTLVVTAISLLIGGRSEPGMVRPGATEAVVEGRFIHDGTETILRRVIPASGRSRAYVDGRLASVAELADLGAQHVDLHGQRDHQSLLSPKVQRRALDRFGRLDVETLRTARRELRGLEDQLAALGGDERDRAREIDLLRFQVDELDAAAIVDATEDDDLRTESELLADAGGHREAAERAVFALSADGGGLDAMATALAALQARTPFESASSRLHALRVELEDVAGELRRSAESIESDPSRLAAIGDRRRQLQELRRKYGSTLAEVLEWHRSAADRLAELEDRDGRAAVLEAQVADAASAVVTHEAALASARRAAAPELAAQIEAQLPDLALPNARVAVEVDGAAGADVRFLFAANPGMPLQPLAKVASGGESARAMLGLRLVLSDGPPVQIFDEVDAGIGGSTAIAVGRALARVGVHHQVIVVTHLAQVAAWADTQVVVDKVAADDTTITTAAEVTGEARITELARMLSGTPDSAAARDHARELLESALVPPR